MSDNLKLWEAVERTDPKQVKPITGKPYKGTSPKPYYLVQKATETFGPCGIGWGFHIVSERVEDGSAGDKVHIAHVRLWYVWDGKRGELDHVGQTMFAGKNKNGPYTDEDAPKKSVTDALVKALSMIGFAGDIFIGRYDDSKYVQELHDEARNTNPAPSQARVTPANHPVTRTDTGPAGVPLSDADQETLVSATKTAGMMCADPDTLREWWSSQVPKLKPYLSPDRFDALKAWVVAEASSLKIEQEAA